MIRTKPAEGLYPSLWRRWHPHCRRRRRQECCWWGQDLSTSAESGPPRSPALAQHPRSCTAEHRTCERNTKWVPPHPPTLSAPVWYRQNLRAFPTCIPVWCNTGKLKLTILLTCLNLSTGSQSHKEFSTRQSLPAINVSRALLCLISVMVLNFTQPPVFSTLH